MEMKTYWVGDRPGYPWVFQVLNEKTGTPESLGSFHTVKVVLLDSDNDLVEIPQQNVNITNAAEGIVTLVWPSESVFTEPGLYVLQLELIGDTSVRKTTVQNIRVKELGGVNR